MRPTSTFAQEVIEDVGAVLSVLRAAPRGRALPTGALVAGSERSLERVRGALVVLQASGAVTFEALGRGAGRGYERVWLLVGGGRISLWEPSHGARRRRLYASRQAALDASRRTQGPGAEAREIQVVIDRRRGVRSSNGARA